MKTILVTGGLGYIGSHTAVELQQAGYNVVIIDDLSNSELFIGERIEKITGKKVIIEIGDLCNKEWTLTIFKKYSFDGVIHFAASKAVGESMEQPLRYYRNNLVSLLNVLECMDECDVKSIVFSSSCTVYGQPDVLPVTENTPFKKSPSAYGSTKQMGEDILEKTSALGKIRVIALRYFNPAGAHESFLIGELPKGIPQNLVPFITQTAIGKRKELIVYGNDYSTKDGTCIRDYIHITDLAKAHIVALERLLERIPNSNFEAFNVGTGRGVTVLEMIQTFENINNTKLKYRIGPRRPGDNEAVYADATYCNQLLGWTAKLGTEDMLYSAWQWQKQLES